MVKMQVFFMVILPMLVAGLVALLANQLGGCGAVYGPLAWVAATIFGVAYSGRIANPTAQHARS